MNRRLRVIVPGLMLGLVCSLSCFGSTPYPFGLLLGPFAMLVGISPEAPYYSERGMWIEAIVLLARTVCHPIKPNGATGALSGVGLFLWFFCGLVYMSDGC